MARYTITYRCGHQANKQLYGPHKSREGYVAWCGANADCPDCAAADRAATVDAVEVEYDLPTLTGSEKQVAWARDLRVKMIGDYLKYTEEMERRVKPETAELFARTRDAILVAMSSKASAKWWIDNRERDAATIAQAVYAEGIAC